MSGSRDQVQSYVKPNVLNPIQDKGPSPLSTNQAKHNIDKHVGSNSKKSGKRSNPQNSKGVGQNPEQEAYRNHQVNYSFGEQPFTKEVQYSQRFGGESPRLSSLSNRAPTNVGLGPQRNGLPRSGSKNFFQPTNAVISSMQSGEGESATNSKAAKSAVSVTSVMGHFEQPHGGTPNIFAQSLQQSPLQSPKPPRQSKPEKQRSGKPPPEPMTQTLQNFSNTVSKISDMEQMVQEGKQLSKDRQSQHSLEVTDMGLRKSQEGSYEPMRSPDKGQVNSGPDQTYNESDSQPPTAPEKETSAKNNNTLAAGGMGGWWNSKVPKHVHEQMVQRGLRPSSKQDGHFIYDSDTFENYEMISNEFDYEELRKVSNFGIKQYKDCVYKGLLNEKRQRDGLGVLIYSNGRVYEGEWLENKRCGRGYELFSTGNSYHGSYQDGKANGKGVYQWQNGEVYDGEWLLGIKHGYGVWKGTNGESYIGQWQAGKAEGYGVHVFENGDKYEGEWLQCLRHGNGSDFFANGDCYVGQYQEGKPEGFGQYKWKNGSSYTGQFANGLKHGHGKWKKRQADEYGNRKCNQYEGKYEYDKKHGHGVFEWESGNRYEGNYNEDERHGYGMMKWMDESTYMGIWDQGIQHGVGVMFFPDGLKRAGVFEENVFQESLKRRDQLDPYRDLLGEECLKILEDILRYREHSKAELFGPLEKSKAELMQKDLGNQTLNNISQGSLPREASEEGNLSLQRQEQSQVIANDLISDNASVINQQMRQADKEDFTQEMQQANPMRESLLKSIGAGAKQQVQVSLEKVDSEQLPPMTVTATTPNKQSPHYGRTIEVQTDLSMVTMEQYSQGYNSKAFDRTNEFEKGKSTNRDNQSQGSPLIRFQNATEGNTGLQPSNQPSVNQSNRDFQNVLSKSQFQDTKHQREILGGGNPNEDTESEWNRNNSSMMVRKNIMQGTVSNSIDNADLDIQNNYHPSRGKGNRGQTKINSLSQSRKSRDNSQTQQPANQNQNSTYTSPYHSHNRIERLKPSIPVKTGKRDPKLVDRSAIRGRQGQRKDRSLPAAKARNNQISIVIQKQNVAGVGANNEFVVPGPQHQKPSKSINRNNINSILTEQKKPQPQKFFQSQYGQSTFVQQQQQMHQQQQQHQHQQQLREQQLQQQHQSMPGMLPPPQSYMNRSSYVPPPRQYPTPAPPPMIETPELHGYFPIAHHHSEQRPSYQYGRDPFGPQMVNPGGLDNNHGLPDISGARRGGKHDTPVIHANMKRNYPNTIANPKQRLQYNYDLNQYATAFGTGLEPQIIESRREDILTPSPKLQHPSEYVNKISNNRHFNESAPHQRNFQNKTETQHGIAVEPMFGNINDNRPSEEMPPINDNLFNENYRSKTPTSSQKTLRYNEFELVQKQVENDPNYAVHLDEADDKDSDQASGRKAPASPDDDLQYPDIKMQKLYESKDARLPPPVQNQRMPSIASQLQSSNKQPPFINSRTSLPKMGLGQSLQMQQRQERERQHLNSNDTQLANHTINLQASNSQHNSPLINSLPEEHPTLPNTRIVHRSQPPTQQHQTSKISVKRGISIMNPIEIRAGRFKNSEESKKLSSNGSPPISMAQYKFVNAKSNKRSLGNSNSNSRSRFDFMGPYAQNLKKPKVFEARGTQKIAMKNHIASLQQAKMSSKNAAITGSGPFNSEVFAQQRNSQQAGSIDDRGEKHSHRMQEHQYHTGVGSEEFNTGNYVIQHSMLPQNRLQDSTPMPPLNGLQQQMAHANKSKRVWVPYNKKIKLRGMQQNMQARSSGGGYNPLLNSQ